MPDFQHRIVPPPDDALTSGRSDASGEGLLTDLPSNLPPNFPAHELAFAKHP